jgi:hypothetical protein
LYLSKCFCTCGELTSIGLVVCKDLVLLALLHALACSQIIICQVVTTYIDHQFDCGELSACAVALTEMQFFPPSFPEGTGVDLPGRGKEFGRDIPLQT